MDRKCHLVADTPGLVRAVRVHAAKLRDGDEAKLVLPKLAGRFRRLSLIWADGGYGGKLIKWTAHFGHWVLRIVKRTDLHRFVVLPKRWVVERTFAWLGKYRRLSKDYECPPASSEAMIQLAMINLMIRRRRPG